MFSRSALLAALTLAVAVAANPVLPVRKLPVTIPFVKRMNFTGTLSLLEHDQKRVQHLKARANARLNGKPIDASVVPDATGSGSIAVTNQLVDYVASVGIFVSVAYTPFIF